MRKFYVLNIILSMMILCSTSVRAQVASMADLFGKYKFTADVEVTEAGKASEANFVKEGEVVITKDAANIYDAQITGFAVNNGTEAMKVNAINTETCKFQVKNPSGNNYGAMGGLYYSVHHLALPRAKREITFFISPQQIRKKIAIFASASKVGHKQQWILNPIFSLVPYARRVIIGR